MYIPKFVPPTTIYKFDRSNYIWFKLALQTTLLQVEIIWLNDEKNGRDSKFVLVPVFE